MPHQRCSIIVKNVSTLQSSAGSKIFSITHDNEGNLYEIGYAEGVLDVQEQQSQLKWATLYVSKSKFEEDKRVFQFISLFPELVIAEDIGSYDISVVNGGKDIYIIGPFLGDRVEQFDTEASEAFFFHLNSAGEVIQQFFFEGAQGFLPLGLSGPFLFGNYKGELRLRKDDQDEILDAEVPDETEPTPKAFIAKYERFAFQWFKFLDVQSLTLQEPLLTLTSIASDDEDVYIGGSFQGALIYENKYIAQNKCKSIGFLLKLSGEKGELLWTHTQTIGYDSTDSVYLSLSVGGKRGKTLFAVSLICDEDLVLVEKIGSHGSQEKKVQVKTFKPDEFYRIYANKKRVYVLSVCNLYVYDFSLHLLSKTEMRGMVGNNYTKPLTSLDRQLYLGLGAQKDFVLGSFLLSRVSPETTIASNSQSVVLGL